MSQTLEERVAALESKVEELSKSHISNGHGMQKDWRSTIGMFAGDPVMKEIIEEGRKIRQADREASRQ